jgi:hypothetical protein
MPEINIDTASYERKNGKPVGRAFWMFRIVSPSVTTKDYIFTVDKPMTFQAACDRAKEVASLRRSDQIVLLVDDG